MSMFAGLAAAAAALSCGVSSVMSLFRKANRLPARRRSPDAAPRARSGRRRQFAVEGGDDPVLCPKCPPIGGVLGRRGQIENNLEPARDKLLQQGGMYLLA